MKNLILAGAMLFVFGTVASAQTLNFTIDGAATSGGTVSQTISSGGSDYLLEAVHSTGTLAALWDIGGGDEMFYWSNPAAGVHSWEITLKKDGLPINFDLNSVDYASFTALTHIYDMNNGAAGIITTGADVGPGSTGSLPIDFPANALDISSFTIEGTTDQSTQQVDFHNINVTAICSESTNSITAESCASYTVPSGDETYSTSGTVMDTLVNAMGCDSILTIDLTISNVGNGITDNGDGTLTADDAGATYQWIDCNDPGNVLAGETTQNLEALGTHGEGDYAVILTNGSCVDTSACVNVLATGIEESKSISLNIYPNPTSGIVHFSEFVTAGDIRNVIGEVVFTIEQTDRIDIAELKSGIYFLKVEDRTYQLVKE